MEVGEAKLRKTVKLEDKLFCFELKENSNSKHQFFKVHDRVTNYYIFFPLTAISGFLDMLNCCIGFDSQQQQQQCPFSRQFIDHDKVISFDIGRNTRGRFLKVSVTSRSNYKHAYLIIPSGDSENNGWKTFRSVLMELNDTARFFFSLHHEGVVMAGTGVQTHSQSETETSSTRQQEGRSSNSENYKVMEASGKRFLFNIVKNKWGQSLKIREVNASCSPYITVPMSCLQRFYQNLAVFIKITKHSAQLHSNRPQIPHAARARNGRGIKSQFSKVMDRDEKRFLFDLASNNRGPFLKIREVTNGSDFYITVPLSSLETFYDIIITNSLLFTPMVQRK